MKYQWLGELRQHIPDLLVASNGRCEFWECKRKAEADTFWIRKRAEQLAALLAPFQVGYRVVSGRELFQGNYLSNAKLLRRFAKHIVSPSVAHEAELQVRRHRTLTVGHLSRLLGHENSICDVLALVYSGTLAADMRAKLTEQSEIRLPNGNWSPPWVWQLFDVASE